MDNTLLVNSKDKSKFYMVDVLNRLGYITNRDVNAKYPKDDVTVHESIGTLAFINREYNIYGILKERQSNIGIVWISIDLAEKDDKFRLLANKHGSNLMDITEYGLDILNPKWSKKLHKPVIAKNLNFMPMSKNEFLTHIGVITEESINESEITTSNVENIVDNTEDIKDSNSINNEQTNTNVDSKPELNKNNLAELSSIFENYKNDLENRLANIIKREEAINIKEANLMKKSNKLNKLLAEYEGLELNHIAETIIDVDLVSGIDDNEVQSLNDSVNTYEFILKMLSKNDCISIPKEFYSKLKVRILKSIEANMAYTKYKVLATIKFDSNSINNIVCILDCDDENNNYRVIILKKYGNNSIDNIDINNYILEYTKWKKQTFNEVK